MSIKKDSKKTRTEYTIRNIIAGLGNNVIGLLLPFIVRTILIKKLGADYVGVSSLFISILQILNVTELGFASAIVYSMYEPVAKNDISEIKKKISLFRTIYVLVGIIILFAGLLVIPFIPKLIRGDVPPNLNIYLVFFIYLVNTVISYCVFGYKNSILVVYQRNDLISSTASLVSIARCLIQIIVILGLKNFYLFAIAIPATTLIGNLYISHLTNKLHPELRDNYKFSLSGISCLKKQIVGIAIGRISLVCRNSFDSIIISILFGLTMTAIYSNYYFVFSSLSGFLSVLLVSMSASVGNSLVTESLEKNRKDHNRFDFYYEFIVSFCTICLFSLYQPFMQVWAGDMLMLPFSTVILFCLYFYINHLAQVRSVYSEAAGLWWFFKRFAIGEVIADLILNLVLGLIWGINGIIIATIITVFICSFIGCTVITFKKLFLESPRFYFLYNLLYFIVAIVGCYVVYLISMFIVVDSWLCFFAKAVFCATVAILYLFGIYFILGFSRKYLVSMFMHIKHRLKRVGGKHYESDSAVNREGK